MFEEDYTASNFKEPREFLEIMCEGNLEFSIIMINRFLNNNNNHRIKNLPDVGIFEALMTLVEI